MQVLIAVVRYPTVSTFTAELCAFLLALKVFLFWKEIFKFLVTQNVLQPLISFNSTDSLAWKAFE